MKSSSVLRDALVSDREAEVLALVGEHRTNAEIAARLYISVRTVESHVSSLLRKLMVDDRRGLVDVAESLGAEAGSDGGDSVVPPAVTPAAVAPVLPRPLTSFVGRASERADLAAALTRNRLVTAVGPGGVGKTRLALAVAADVADRYAAGSRYVDLVPVTDPAMVGAAVAASLGYGELPGQSLTDTVTARLRDAEALLVLDNCEHLVDGVVRFVERLLSDCPQVVVLATSRARLLVPYESVFPVAGLSRSGDDGGDAVALFLDRAGLAGWVPASDDDRRRVEAVCESLDGLALAIELGAARVSALGLGGLEAGLAHRLGVLTGGSRLDDRHRSLRSMLDWSYELLTSDDQAVLRRVAVLAAPFTADAATVVVTATDGRSDLGSSGVADPGSGGVAETLARLADHSLLVVGVDPARGVTRYRMLETIRQYGQERLDEVGEGDDVRTRHLAWCLATARSLDLDDDDAGPSFDAVADDLRAALGWATGVEKLQVEAHELALRLAELTFARGLASEAQSRFEDAARLAGDDDRVAAPALGLAGDTALSRLDGDEALRLFRAAADAARRADDHVAAALWLTRAAELLSRSPGLLSELPPTEEVAELLAQARTVAGNDPRVAAAVLTVEVGGCAPRSSSVAEGERALELAGQVDDQRMESAALDYLTVIHLAHGQVLEGAATTRRRLEYLAGQPARVDLAFELTDALHMATMTSIGAGDLATARRYAERRRDLLFHRGEDHLLVNWLMVRSALAGELDEVVKLAEQFRIGWERVGRRRLHGFAVAPAAAAMTFGLRGDDEARAEWLEVFTAMRSSAYSAYAGPETGYEPTFEAILRLHRGEVDAAVAVLEHGPESFDRSHTAVWRHWYAALWAESAVLAGLDDQDERLATARSITAGNPVAGVIVDRAELLRSVSGQGSESGEGSGDGLVPLAEAFAAAGCVYQQARTLLLAGGPARAEGEALMTSTGAAPMATPA